MGNDIAQQPPRHKRLLDLALVIGVISCYANLIMQWSFNHINPYMAVVGFGLTGYGTLLLLMAKYFNKTTVKEKDESE